MGQTGLGGSNRSNGSTDMILPPGGGEEVSYGQFHGKWENWRKWFFLNFEACMMFRIEIFGQYL